VDRRIQRTRDSLREALMALMVERGWEDIDIQTLCERANIGRSTFYQHFDNKEALLKANFAGLRDALLAHAAHHAGPLGFVSGLLVHLHENREVFRALIARRSGHYVQDRFRELLVELVGRSTAPRERKGWQAGARAHYLGGALFELLVWWLGSHRPQSPQEIELLFRQWSAGALPGAPA
jgi:AcrR family transcriptional regulator